MSRNVRLTEQQAREWLALWAHHGFNIAAIARSRGESRKTWFDRISGARRLVPDSGVVVTDVPDSLRFDRTTVQYDARGNVIQEWRRLNKSAADIEALAASLGEALARKCPSCHAQASSVTTSARLFSPSMIRTSASTPGKRKPAKTTTRA